MTVTLPTGRTVKLTFVHSSHDFETYDGAPALRVAIDADAKRLGRRLTLCEISQVGFSGSTENDVTEKSYATLGLGTAVCHPNDIFSKAEGRKHALTKALVAAELNYDERAAVWAAYRAEFTGPTVASVLKNIEAMVRALEAAGELHALQAIEFGVSQSVDAVLDSLKLEDLQTATAKA